MTIERGASNITGKPPSQVLTGAQVGFPTPSGNPQQFDQIHGGPPPLGIRDEAYAEAARLLQDSKFAILVSQILSDGLRRGFAQTNNLSIDPNLYEGNPLARPFNIEGRFVITPVNPTPAMLAAATLLAQANFAPGAYPTPPYTENYEKEYQTGIIPGRGNTIVLPLRTAEVAIVEELGITTFSSIAEYELVWLMAHGIVQATTSAPPNTGAPMINARRGWPFGTAERPAKLYGMSRIAPQTGPIREATNGGGSVVLNVQDTGVTTPTYTPAPHFVRIVLRGWIVKIDPKSDAPLSKTIGATMSNPTGKY